MSCGFYLGVTTGFYYSFMYIGTSETVSVLGPGTGLAPDGGAQMVDTIEVYTVIVVGVCVDTYRYSALTCSRILDSKIDQQPHLFGLSLCEWLVYELVGELGLRERNFAKVFQECDGDTDAGMTLVFEVEVCGDSRSQLHIARQIGYRLCRLRVS
eukprot:620959-Amorphochlora_amoeboformis.AAC.2